ncbi:MAG TPA: hypothetical protein ENI80_00900 [Acidiferrobacteraceae bacterium]|nr:hypothetical protein [Acidiferrobacteraceae bacterium]
MTTLAKPVKQGRYHNVRVDPAMALNDLALLGLPGLPKSIDDEIDAVAIFAAIPTLRKQPPPPGSVLTFKENMQMCNLLSTVAVHPDFPVSAEGAPAPPSSRSQAGGTAPAVGTGNKHKHSINTRGSTMTDQNHMDPEGENFKEQMQAEWDRSPDIRTEFHNNFDSFLAYQKADVKGLTKSTLTHVLGG